MDNPLRLLIFTAAAVFASETAVILVLNYLPPQSTPVEALIDALVLGAFLFPVLYIYYLRPMQQSRRQLDQVKAKLELAEIPFRESNEGMLISDHANHIIRVNPAFTRITGYAPEEVIGKNPHILSSGRHGPDFYKALWGEIARSGSWSGEIWNRRKNGEIYPEWLSLRAIKNEAGDYQYHMAIFSDITQRKNSEEKIKYLANYDPLTSLPNRMLFYDRLRQTRELALRDKNGFAVIFIDLDEFKPVNDTYGHACGDQLLQEAAHRLLACVRNVDTVARFGGDEFLVILQDVPRLEKAIPVTQKILDALSQPFHLDHHEIKIAASAGITHWDATRSPAAGKDDLESLVGQADQAMYQAKQAGRGTYRVWQE